MRFSPVRAQTSKFNLQTEAIKHSYFCKTKGREETNKDLQIYKSASLCLRSSVFPANVLIVIQVISYHLYQLHICKKSPWALRNWSTQAWTPVIFSYKFKSTHAFMYTNEAHFKLCNINCIYETTVQLQHNIKEILFLAHQFDRPYFNYF